MLIVIWSKLTVGVLFYSSFVMVLDQHSSNSHTAISTVVMTIRLRRLTTVMSIQKVLLLKSRALEINRRCWDELYLISHQLFEQMRAKNVPEYSIHTNCKIKNWLWIQWGKHVGMDISLDIVFFFLANSQITMRSFNGEKQTNICMWKFVELTDCIGKTNSFKEFIAKCKHLQ